MGILQGSCGSAACILKLNVYAGVDVVVGEYVCGADVDFDFRGFHCDCEVVLVDND